MMSPHLMATDDPNTRDRLAIDDLHRSLPHATHYEVLGIDRGADAEAIAHAHRGRAERFSPAGLSSPLTNAYRQRLEAIHEAFDAALAVLGDPVRRYLYDQELDQRARGAHAPAAATGPAVSRMTSVPGASAYPRAPTPPGGFRPPVAARTPALSQPTSPGIAPPPPTDPLAVLRPEHAPAFSPGGPSPAPRFKQTTHHLATGRGDEESERRSSLPPAPESSSADRTAALEAQVHTLQGEVALLLSEVERLAVSIQLTIARQLEPEGIKADQLVTAGQALVSSRVVIATLLARREETAGRWEAAAALWQRASRARPNDAGLLVNAANALRKADTDLAAAEALARQAVAIDPDHPEAHAALAVIEARRNRLS